MTDTNRYRDQAREVYARFQHGMDRGHDKYVHEVKRLNDFYLGGGRQWLEDVRDFLEGEGRPCVELNMLLSSINAALGYQISNRMEIAYAPRGGRGDAEIAKVLSKLSKSTLDACNYRWKESELFADGLIMRRGYLDMRVSFDESLNGDITADVLDPRDVIPDPDSTSYDPDEWADVLVSRYYTADEAERLMGKDVREALLAHMPYGNAPGWGAYDDGDPDTDRNRFGGGQRFYGRGQSYLYDGDVIRFRFLSRQINEYLMSTVAIWPDTREVRVVEGMDREMIAKLIEQGVMITKRKMRRVRWVHAAPDCLISDTLSPYPSFSVIPFFPLFRRGETIGLVDNATSPQEMLNKVWSSVQHILSSTANSGWQGEAGVLENMDDDEFMAESGSTGLVLLRKAGTQAFEKIQPNQIPAGLDRLMQQLPQLCRDVMGINEQLMGAESNDMSGIAIQSLQHAAQQQLALPLDNLARTRGMVSRWCLWVYQNVFILPRVIRYTEMDVFGRKKDAMYIANQPQPDGSILNDLTMGEYDFTINEVPMQITFENSQFSQAIEMKKAGVAIPDEILIRYSNLLDKEDIIDAMQNAKQDPRAQSEANLMEAQTALAHANANRAAQEAVAKAVEAMFSGIRTAQVIATMPNTAELADQLMRSAGFIDQDQAPIIGAPPPGMLALPPPTSTNPLTPDNPEAGLATGMTSLADPVAPEGVPM